MATRPSRSPADGAQLLAGHELAGELADALVCAQVGRAGHAAGQDDEVAGGEVVVAQRGVAVNADLVGGGDVGRVVDGDERDVLPAAAQHVGGGERLDGLEPVGKQDGNA